MRITAKLTIEIVKFPSWVLLTWKAFTNKWFFIPKAGFVFALSLIAAGRFGYLQKD